MIGLVLVSHESLAAALLLAAEALVGPQPAVGIVGLAQGDAPETFQERLRAALEAHWSAEGVVILSDLLGGTPWNVAVAMAQEEPYCASCAVVSGANLTMLLEALVQREAALSALGLARLAARMGAAHIQCHPASLASDEP